jgi:hypothetical protein
MSALALLPTSWSACCPTEAVSGWVAGFSSAVAVLAIANSKLLISNIVSCFTMFILKESRCLPNYVHSASLIALYGY